jgi:hypothetical protein
MYDALLVPELLAGRNRAQATSDGTFPATQSVIGGLFQVGDIVWNLGSSGPSYWQCTAITSGTVTSTLTWSPVGTIYAIRTATASTTLSMTDSVVLCPAGGYTLPAAAYNYGSPIVYAKGTITLTPASGNIGGASALTLTVGQSVTIVSDSSNLWAIA